MAISRRAPYRHGLRCLLCAAAILGLAGCSWLNGLVSPEQTPAQTPAQSQPETETSAARELPSPHGQPIPDTVATVLPAGASLGAHTDAGYIQIEAGPGSLRTVTWGSNRYHVATQPRSTPFPGAESIGLSYDGKLPGRQARGGVNNLHYEENFRNFEVPYAMKVWTQIRRIDFKYNNNGLAVGWRRKGDTLHVEVWQFRINGEIPQQLPGATDSAINFKAPLAPATATVANATR